MSCQNGIGNKDGVEKSDTLIKKTDPKDYYLKRLNNIPKISKLNKVFKEYPRVDVIILQKNKCGLCDSAIYSYITGYASSAREKLVLLAVNDAETDWKKELNHDPALNRMEIIEISNESAQESGLSFVENIQVFFVNRKVKSYKVL